MQAHMCSAAFCLQQTGGVHFYTLRLMYLAKDAFSQATVATLRSISTGDSKALVSASVGHITHIPTVTHSNVLLNHLAISINLCHYLLHQATYKT